jgi:hypothetical protein
LRDARPEAAVQMTIREYCAARMRLARKIAVPLGVVFIVLCSAYQVTAKVAINLWYIAAATGYMSPVVAKWEPELCSRASNRRMLE